MSEESPQRVNQWFARGIGIIVSGIFVTILCLTLFNMDQHLFHNDLAPPQLLDYVILMKQIGTFMWTFRVLDLLLLVIIIILGVISAYYLVGYKKVIATQRTREQRRNRY